MNALNSLKDFSEDQWWVKELDKLSFCSGVTADQRRAISVVHNLLSVVKDVTEPPTPPLTLLEAKQLALQSMEMQAWSEQRDAALVLLSADLLQSEPDPDAASIEMIGHFWRDGDDNWHHDRCPATSKTHTPLYRLHNEKD